MTRARTRALGERLQHRDRVALGVDDEIERRLTAQPKISVPTIALQGEADGVLGPDLSAGHAGQFTGPYERRVLPRIGHNPPQEAPNAFAEAVLALKPAR